MRRRPGDLQAVGGLGDAQRALLLQERRQQQRVSRPTAIAYGGLFFTAENAIPAEPGRSERTASSDAMRSSTSTATGPATRSSPMPHPSAAGRPEELPGEVDVLIVGCGPAGLVLAAQLARFPGIRTAVVDRRDGPLEVGQADGVACRTVEMFEAFGLADRLVDEALLGQRGRLLAA